VSKDSKQFTNYGWISQFTTAEANPSFK